MTLKNTKILSQRDLVIKVKKARSLGSKIGFTNGCFDILHVGHIRYLKKARTECDILILGLNSDRSVREIKGSERPINNENARAEVLAELSCVDLITVFDESTPIELIKAVMPDVLFKGGDWKEDEIAGSREVKDNGGKVMLINYEQGHSTTGMISRMRKLGDI